jgi:beta-galactosidase
VSDSGSESRPLGRYDLSHVRPANVPQFLYGAAYYPEHWSDADRDKDAERMAEAGFNVVRMAEFAWDRIEPEESRFEFGFFDRAIEALGARGIRTILCTPTAAPPRWLTLRHPDTLRVDENGVRLEHGSRQQCCLASHTFRSYSRRVTRAMARHYRANPNVIGWQTDNEFYCHFAECHCASCRETFVDYLRQRYKGSIAALNHAWGTAFWAQTYRAFEDIPTPRSNKPTYLNPAHRLEYHLFLSYSVARFQRQQVDTLRKANPKWFITHNGTFAHIDYRGPFTSDLDFLGYDCYPFFCTDPAQRPHHQAWGLDRARAWSGNFIIPEQQSGPGGQQPYFHDNPEPGELRRMTCTSIARGADSLLFFRWRTCRFGAEEYWCGILDHDNVPRRRYDEVARVGEELRRVGPEILGTHVYVDCAVAYADMRGQNAHNTLSLGLPHQDEVAKTVHQALFERGYAVGLVHPADTLADLKLYVIPHWAVFDPDWVEPLGEWVAAGGTLVIGARTATRDLNNNVIAETLPGCLRTLAGVTVQEYGRQNCPEKRPLILQFPESTVRSDLWYEALELEENAQALAIWKGRHLSGLPAVTLREHGKGRVLYIATYLTPPIVDALLPQWIKLAGLDRLWPDAPPRVQVVLRRSADKNVWFFINDNDEAATLSTAPEGLELLSNRETSGGFTLGPNQVAIIRQ